MRPRVFVDCRWTGRTGLGRYVDNVMAELTKLDHGLSLVAGVLRTNEETPAWLDADDLEVVEIDAPWFTLGEQRELPKLLRRTNVDLAHFTNFNVPLAYRGPVVTTVNDLTLIDHPTAGPTVADRLRFHSKAAVMRLVLRRAVRGSRVVVVPSEFVAGQISSRFGIPNRSIVVTPDAPTKFPSAGPDALSALGVSAPFVLSIGTAYPHKNLLRLLEAMQLLSTESFPPTLVLAGPDDAHRQLIRTEVERRNLSGRVLVLGHVTDAELGVLFGAADSYVFPSLSEGFGLPGVEAMSAGVPVASSSATCLPEVFADGAVYFDPLDAAEMALTMQRVHGDPALRRQLIAAGRVRAASFTWRRTAEQTLAVYRQALNDG